MVETVGYRVREGFLLGLVQCIAWIEVISTTTSFSVSGVLWSSVPFFPILVEVIEFERSISHVTV